MKRFFSVLLLCLIGAFVWSFADKITGVKYTDVSSFARYAHKAIYMVWGYIFLTAAGKIIDD